jgi:hypothetical protein
MKRKVFFCQETLAQIEHKLNHVIGLKHALELVSPLHTVLSAGVESSLLNHFRQQGPILRIHFGRNLRTNLFI